ncbi:hypothetical protein APA_61 [Pseudanabaena sp. lw0831]|nr:hypothetical protein APA_61 [Pseudanabaena sp. lw0831]
MRSPIKNILSKQSMLTRSATKSLEPLFSRIKLIDFLDSE